MSVGFGAFIAQQYWPVLHEYLSTGTTLDTADATTTAGEINNKELANQVVASAPVDPEANLSGTRSSISAVPQQLILTATRPGRNPREGFASIGTDPQSPQIYVAGAMLVNGAVILEIYADRVVLERDGQRAVLALRSSSQTEHSAILVVGGAAPPTVDLPQPTSEIVTQFIRPTPVYAGETMTGMQVYAGSRSGAFHQWGLKSGDIITSIDGVPLTDMEQAAGLLRVLVSGHAVTATVRRAQATVTVSLDGALIQREIERDALRSTHSPEMLAGSGP